MVDTPSAASDTRIRISGRGAGAYGGIQYIDFAYQDYGNYGYTYKTASIQAVSYTPTGNNGYGALVFATKNASSAYNADPTEKMRITEGGQVGINISSPQYLLDVNGTGRFTGTITGNNNIELINAFGSYVLVGEGTGASQYGVIDWDATNNRLRIATQPYAFGANGGQITLTTSGNVGIGTTSPAYRLEVNNSTGDSHMAAVGTAPSLQLMSANTSPANWGTIGMATTNHNFITGAVAGDLAITNRGTTAGNILFGFGTSEKMRLTSGGNLLVGTTSDNGRRLQIEGSIIQNGNNTNYQANTQTFSSGGSITFGRNNSGYGGSLGDNIAGIIIVTINEPNTNINSNSAVYIGSVNKPRGQNATVTQISKTLGGGITAFTVTNSGDDISVTATCSSGSTLRATLTFIGGGGMY